MKVLELMDFTNTKHETDIDLDELDKIDSITISVISGDEIATITYKNGETVSIDADILADGKRFHDDYDGTYILYSSGSVNRLDEFEKRSDTYWWC